MRWKVHGRRTMYESDWVNVYLDDVELPDGTHIDHHVLTMPKASQTAIVLDDAEEEVLLVWRHRFITDKWGWEVPAGWVEPGEKPKDSIRREIVEETGHKVGSLRVLAEYDALPGISSMRFTTWIALNATRISEPDPTEQTSPQWHRIDSIAKLMKSQQIHDGPSLTALSYFLATRS